jgi:hypothetical protein
VDIHYGMSFVIMNFADEVLCVDGLGKVKVKPLSVVQSTDCALFKIVDLTDVTNPGELNLSRNYVAYVFHLPVLLYSVLSRPVLSFPVYPTAPLGTRRGTASLDLSVVKMIGVKSSLSKISSPFLDCVTATYFHSLIMLPPCTFIQQPYRVTITNLICSPPLPHFLSCRSFTVRQPALASGMGRTSNGALRLPPRVQGPYPPALHCNASVRSREHAFEVIHLTICANCRGWNDRKGVRSALMKDER